MRRGGPSGERGFEVGAQRRSITFDGEVVVSVASAQPGGEGASGQQRIGADVLILQVQGFEQRDGDFDFIGLFDGVRVACYGQGGLSF